METHSMTEKDMIREIHTDVREIRARVDSLATTVAAAVAAQDRRLIDLETHVSHNGPTRWDVGATIAALVAGVGAILNGGG